MIDNEQDKEEIGGANSELNVCVDDSEVSDMQISDEESDQDLDVEDTEVYAEAFASDKDLPGLGNQCQNDGDLQSSLADWAVSFGLPSLSAQRWTNGAENKNKLQHYQCGRWRVPLSWNFEFL